MCRRTETCRQVATACRTGRCRHRLMGHHHDAEEVEGCSYFEHARGLRQQYKACMHTCRSTKMCAKTSGTLPQQPVGTRAAWDITYARVFLARDQLNRRTLHRKRADRPSVREARQRAGHTPATSSVLNACHARTLPSHRHSEISHTQSIDQQDCMTIACFRGASVSVARGVRRHRSGILTLFVRTESVSKLCCAAPRGAGLIERPGGAGLL
jgi:hypothetical protein